MEKREMYVTEEEYTMIINQRQKQADKEKREKIINETIDKFNELFDYCRKMGIDINCDKASKGSVRDIWINKQL